MRKDFKDFKIHELAKEMLDLEYNNKKNKRYNDILDYVKNQSINYRMMFDLTCECFEYNNEYIDILSRNHSRIDEYIELLKEFDIETFAISYSGTNLIEYLCKFDEAGYMIDGYTEINTSKHCKNKSTAIVMVAKQPKENKLFNDEEKAMLLTALSSYELKLSNTSENFTRDTETDIFNSLQDKLREYIELEHKVIDLL